MLLCIYDCVSDYEQQDDLPFALYNFANVVNRLWFFTYLAVSGKDSYVLLIARGRIV